MDNYHPMFELTGVSLYYFSVLGRALYTAQHFEVSCKQLAALLEIRDVVREHGLSVLDNETFLDRAVKAWCEVLGRNTLLIQQRYPLPRGDCTLVDGREARNELVHSAAFYIHDSTDIEASLNTELAHLASLVTRIATADKVVVLLYNLLGDVDLPAPAYFLQYEERVVDWVLAKSGSS